jgi:hypothetical protein
MDEHPSAELEFELWKPAVGDDRRDGDSREVDERGDMRGKKEHFMQCKPLQFRLLTLLIALAVGPPLLARYALQLSIEKVIIAQLVVLAAMVPAATFLWQNCAPRR